MMHGSLLIRLLPEDPVEKVPMHPEDYAALLEWVRAKEQGNPGGPEISPENHAPSTS